MKRPSFQFYPSDWMVDPGLSTLDYFHTGVFIRLLCFAFQTGGELRYCDGSEPLAVTDIANLLGLEANQTQKVIDTLIKHGCLRRRKDDGCLYNARMVKDCKEADEYFEARRNSAQVAAAARWNKNKECDTQCERNATRNANASKPQCQNDASSSSTSSSININSHTNARPREDNPLPRNMPESEEKAIEMCLGIGAPDDFIRQAFQDAYAVGFRDRGNPIINWKAYISAYWMRYQNAQKRKESQKQKPQARVEEPREVIHLRQLN